MDYKAIYDRLCSKAKSENRVKGNGVYYEAHHILPKCVGGTGLVSQYKTHPNVVLLTAREHFVAHKLLLKIYPNSKKLKFAFNGMCNQNAPNQQRDYKVTSKDYEMAKMLFIESFSGENHHLYKQGWKQSGEKNPAYGKPQSEELRQRKREAATKSWQDPKLREEQSKRHKGRKDSEETRLKKKQPKSEEHKKRIGLAHKGRKCSLDNTIKMMIGRYGEDWYNMNYPNGYCGTPKKLLHNKENV